MAQDFGDDVGEMLIRNITRYGEKAIGLILNEYFKSAVRDWQQAKFEAEGMSKEDAAIKAEAMASREHICMPFGNATDASYFAQVVRENGTYAAAMTDDNGNGYVQFAKDDIQKVRECATQFSDVMISLKCREISELIANEKPVTQDVLKNLKLIKDLPDLPKTDDIEHERHGKTEPVADRNEQQGHDLANDPYNHTSLIRDKVLSAREQCRDFEDFKAILAENGIGTRLNDDGELQFYEGRHSENGEMLEFDKSMDWPVNAKTLAGDKYRCDATLDWFEKNTPKEPTAPEHDSAREVIPPQKDLNLICNAVRGDLEERGIQTLDRADGKMGFVVDIDYKKQVVDAVEKHFPGHTPEELGIILKPHHDIGSMTMDAQEPQVTDGSIDMNGSTPDINQGIESHDGMDTMASTLRVEREQNGTEVAPSMVREQFDRSREKYDLNSQAKECRAASKQLSQTNDSPDRDISDKFQQER